MTQHQALRRAAILITALDASTADQLLDHLPEEQASLVRQAVFDLDWIDPAEQQEVLQAFLAGAKQNQDHAVPTTASESNDVELVLSSEAPSPRESIAPTPPPQVTAHVESYPIPYPPRKPVAPREERFDFLRHQPASALARLLEREHPQTIAVVVAHLPPEQSAELLQVLAAELNVEVLRRVADLDLIDPEMIDDMEQELRRAYTVTKIAAAPKTAPAEAEVDDEVPPTSEWHDEPVPVDHANNLANEVEAYRQLARSVPEVTHLEQQSEHEPSVVGRIEGDSSPEHLLVDWSFADVTELSDGDLASVLQQAGSELTMMALAGSDPEFVTRLTGQLAPTMARQFSQRMEEIGPLALRDIEAAQQRIAEYAEQLAAEGIIEQKQSQPFAAAA